MKQLTLKRLFALALALAMLFTLCACAKDTPDPTETTPPSSSSETKDTEPEKSTEPSSKPSSEPEPSSEEPAEPIPTEPADPDAPVSDMYRSVYTDSEGKEFPHAVPRINLDGEEISALNDTIYQTFVVERSEKFNRSMYGPSYRYYVTDDLLTLLIENTAEWESAPVDYTIYTIRLSDGHILTREEVLEAAGLSAAEFDEAASVAMGHAFCNYQFADIETMDEELRKNILPGGSMWDFIQEQFSQTVSAGNVAEAVPYFEEDGTLAVRGYIYQIAGAEYHEELVPLTNYTPSEYYEDLLNGATD